MESAKTGPRLNRNYAAGIGRVCPVFTPRFWAFDRQRTGWFRGDIRDLSRDGAVTI